MKKKDNYLPMNEKQDSYVPVKKEDIYLPKEFDKHMPWISGQQNQHHPVITRRIMQMQPMAPIPTATKTMSFNVSPDIDEKT